MHQGSCRNGNVFLEHQKKRDSRSRDHGNVPKSCLKPQYMEAFDMAKRRPIPGKIDLGIKKAVEILKASGIETFESCEGGDGHAFTEPTIRFHGTPEAGWRAVAACLAHGLPIQCVRRVWYILDGNEPTGPKWEVVFRKRLS
jgi:hypothetical protein